MLLSDVFFAETPEFTLKMNESIANICDQVNHYLVSNLPPLHLWSLKVRRIDVASVISKHKLLSFALISKELSFWIILVVVIFINNE